MWREFTSSTVPITVQRDPGPPPRLRVRTVSPEPTRDSEWLHLAVTVGQSLVLDRADYAGLWALTRHVTPRGEHGIDPDDVDWDITAVWLSRSVHTIPAPPTNALAVMYLSDTVGAHMSGVGLADLPESDPVAARATLRHMAAAQGKPVESVITLDVFPVFRDWATDPQVTRFVPAASLVNTPAGARQFTTLVEPLPGECLYRASVDTDRVARFAAPISTPQATMPGTVAPLRATAVRSIIAPRLSQYEEAI